MTGLIERLLTQEPFRASDDGMTVAELPPPGKLRNPDGPEAAAHIAELERELKREKVWRCNGDPEDGDGMLEIEALRSALKRMIRNFDLLLAGKPVRDVAETRAEALAAIAIGDR